MTRVRRIAIATAAIAALFVAYEIATSFIAYTDDAYVRSDLVAVAPQVSGRIITVNVSDNQTVAEKNLLATIDPVPFELVVAQRRAEVEEAKAQVAADQETISSAQATLSSAVAAATYAHQTHTRVAVLATSEDAPRAALQKAVDDQQRADSDVDSAKAEVGRAEATAAMHRAAQERAAAALGTAEWQLGRTKMLAPVDGTINNLTVRPGDTAQTDVPLIGIVDAHAWRIMANFKQSFVDQFRDDSMAWVWLDSKPWRLHRARVAGVARGISRDPNPGRLLPYVAPTTDWIRLQRRIPVTLTLVDPPPDLKLYMGADARVLILP
jgi:multidrug efflux system membrane fusion protein